jgi:hypothetical protein
MAKKYKVAVGDVVSVPVEGTLSDASGAPVPFKFDLVCTRKTAEEMRVMSANGSRLVKDIMAEVVTGWKDQRLVLEEDDSAAAFCPEAFEILMNIANMPMVCYSAFVNEQGAKAKNS